MGCRSMTPHDAIALARQHGVTVAVNGDRLRMTAPAEPPSEVIKALQDEKPYIIAALASRPPADTEGLPTGPCPGCGGRLFWQWPAFDPHHAAGEWFCCQCAPVPVGAGPCNACAVPLPSETRAWR